jgi:HPt (histidine-containing phosphotransfer) domain-containing protein
MSGRGQQSREEDGIVRIDTGLNRGSPHGYVFVIYSFYSMDFQAAADEIGISVEAYKRLCSLFLDTTREDLRALASAFDNENREEIGSLAHHIKGAASNMEFEEMMQTAKELQLKAAEAPFSELEELRVRIEHHFSHIETLLGELT